MQDLMMHISIDASKYGAGYINDGVQGCSPQLSVTSQYRPARWQLTDIPDSYNTIRMFDILGFKCVDLT